MLIRMISDIRGAFAFLTILPTGYSQTQPGRIFAYFPLVGLVIGLALVLVTVNPWLSRDVTAFLVLLVWIGLTGGLHLDGFGDACDGLFATVTPERRLEIMKDPRAGTWSVVGLIVLLLGKWILLRLLLSATLPLLLIAPPILGRLAMVIAATRFPYARSSGLRTGLGAHFRDGLSDRHLWIAVFLALLLTAPSIAFVPPPSAARILIAFVLTPLMVLLVGGWASSRLGGGLTGDIYGALCELTELITLFVLTIP